MCPALLSVGWWLSELPRVAHNMQVENTTTMTGTTTNGEAISMSNPSYSDYQRPDSDLRLQAQALPVIEVNGFIMVSPSI